MAGHSKWANIKHKKEKADKQRGKEFSRLAKELISAVKAGGEDPKNNPRLRLAIQKAKGANMPNENIQRNIAKALDANSADDVIEIYELYGHGGVGLVVEVCTDNKHRLMSDLTVVMNKKGGSLARPGAVTFNFSSKGVIKIETDLANSEDLLVLADTVGAEDFSFGKECHQIYTAPEDLYKVKQRLEEEGVVVVESGLEMFPNSRVACDEQTAQANFALIEKLSNLSDVIVVYHNMLLS